MTATAPARSTRPAAPAAASTTSGYRRYRARGWAGGDAFAALMPTRARQPSGSAGPPGQDRARSACWCWRLLAVVIAGRHRARSPRSGANVDHAHPIRRTTAR